MLNRHDIDWEFGREIKTKEDLIQAKAFWRHCYLSLYDDIFSKEMTGLRQQIKDFEKGDDSWQ